MSRFFNKRLPFFGSSALSFGKVYFGQPDTDPLNQDDNSKSPFVNVQVTVEGDAVQNLDVTGKLTNRLFIKGPHAVATLDADDTLVDYDVYYEHENTGSVANASSVAGATLTDALNTVQAAITALAAQSVTLTDIWPVGSLYITAANENPASRLDHGQWELYGGGQILCRRGAYTDSNGETQVLPGVVVGEYGVALTESQIPIHHHMFVSNEIVAPIGSAPWPVTDQFTVAVEFEQPGNADQYRLKGGAIGAIPNIGPTSYTGDSTRHNNLQPGIGVYIWRRYE